MTRSDILRLDIPDALSAVLIPGEKRPLHGGRADIHCADALLVSRSVPVVAVADGPERNPVASSSFLKKFDDAVSASRISFSDRPVEESFSEVVTVVNTLVKTIDYHDSTTFSALIPVANGHNSLGIVLHTGDSLIFRLEPATGAVSQISRTSHVVVGRALALFQTEIISLPTDDLVILTSDGITDLARTRGMIPADFLSFSPPTRTPSAVVERILESVAETRVRLDDITVVCATVGALSVPEQGPSGRRHILT